MSTDKLSSDEQAVIEHVEKGDLPSVPNIEAQKERYQQIATDQIKKRRKINLNVLEADLVRVKAKAIKEGLPYQTLIASVIHKYATGQLKPAESDSTEK
jgi:predicted DNA binding CopG/RHH family protein